MVEVEDLEAVAAFVGEDVEGAVEWIGFEVFGDEALKAVEAFAHVTGLNGEVDLEAASEAEHDRIRLGLECFEELDCEGGLAVIAIE